MVELGPFPILMNQLLNDNTRLRRLRITSEQFTRFTESVAEALVSQICSYNANRTQRQRAITLYNEFFRIPFEHRLHFKDAGGNQSLNAFAIVATLNYDLVLELYDTDTEGDRDRLVTVPRFFDKRGFVQHRGGHLRLDRDGIQLGQMNDTQPRLEYIKLHGSIDWWRDNDNNIFQSFSRETPVLDLAGRAIIYPIHEKHISAEPFFTFYQYFRRRLLFENILVIIGYSFADPSINNAFMDWLNFNSNARLIVVVRGNTQERVRNIFGAEHERIEYISEYFGENGFINALTNALTA